MLGPATTLPGSCGNTLRGYPVVVDEGGGHLQSLIAGAVLLILAFLSVMLGIISDLIRTNRILIENTLEHTRRARFATPVETEPTWQKAVPF